MKSFDYSNVNVEYKINSGLGILADERYCQEITGLLFLTDEFGKRLQIIGKMQAFRLLLGLAQDNFIEPVDIFDLRSETLEIGEYLFDFDINEFKECVQEALHNGPLSDDLIVIGRIEILPKYRGKGLGRLFIKDFTNHFKGGVSLIALKAFPVQYEVQKQEEKDDWTLLMKYETENATYELHQKRLRDYYLKMGFKTIPGINQEIMCLHPQLTNSSFDAIELK